MKPSICMYADHAILFLYSSAVMNISGRNFIFLHQKKTLTQFEMVYLKINERPFMFDQRLVPFQ